MRVRVLRTVDVEALKAGIKAYGRKGRVSLTVGSGYDLPAETAKDLISRGLAVRLEPVHKHAPDDVREARQARAVLRATEQENADLRATLAERDDELVEARAEIARLRAEAEQAEGGVALESLTVAELRALAAEKEIEIPAEAKNKAAILEVVRAALEAAEAEGGAPSPQPSPIEGEGAGGPEGEGAPA